MAVKYICLAVLVALMFQSAEGKAIHKKKTKNSEKGDKDSVAPFKDILTSNSDLVKRQDELTNLRHTLNIDHRNVKLTEGDILIDDGNEHSIKRRVIMRSNSKIWRTRVIPYVLDPSLSQKAVERITQVIADFHSNPTICLRFREKFSDENAYLKFKDGGGCYSYIGRTGFDQSISIGSGCTSYGTVAHEIMHSLGFWHEQSRFDRDNYVKIMLENIIPGSERNFDKKRLETSELFSYYDYGSVMHYYSGAFSSNGQETIKTIPSDIPIGQRAAPSMSDLRAISYLYSCTTPDGTWSEWSPCQYCNQEKTRVCFGPIETACGGNSGIEFHPDKCPCNDSAYWQDWGAWSKCSGLCNQGQRYRNRLCENGIPGNGSCVGEDFQTEACISNCDYWNEWSEWSLCSVTCGDGSQSRSRSCENGIVGQGNCVGPETDTQVCSAGVECDYWNEWSEWSLCGVTCGDGSHSRSRSCENGVVGQGNCVGPETDTQVCSAGVGCDYWNEWSEWSSCSVTCGDGSQSRSRSCENGVVGQGNCVGSETDTQVCSAGVGCDYWNEWSEWSLCDVTCGDGSQSRSRSCENGVVDQGNCIGPETDTQVCSAGVGCDYWNEWSEWSSCDFTCADGSQSRSRSCENGVVGQGNCVGSETDTQVCSAGVECDYWNEWSEWSLCSVTCGDGSQSRSRSCENGVVGQGNCVGPETDTQVCSAGVGCDYWNEWSEWSSCSVTCGDGSQSRSRSCENGVVGQGNCVGSETDTQVCSAGVGCDYWNEWSEWSSCDVTCGDESQSRSRSCENGVVGQGNCVGSETDTQVCSAGVGCDYWNEWSEWSSCSVTCGDGSQSRSRSCENGVVGQGNCVGPETDSQVCSAGVGCDYWNEWSDWSSCGVTCGDGSQSRSRSCENGVVGQGNCVGSETDTQVCSAGVECDYWNEWSEWSLCGVTCGDGSQSRSRSCENGVVGQGNCVGPETDTQVCSAGVGCVYWNEWSEWSSCSVTCGDGSQSRSRSCENGVVGQGNCVGSETDTQVCSAGVGCDYWNEWSEWSLCDVTCGDGSQSRNRSCKNGVVGQGNCVGPETNTQVCSAGVGCDYWNEWSEWSLCGVTCGDGSQIRSRSCENGVVGQGNCVGPETDTQVCSAGVGCDYWNEWSEWSSCDVTCGDESQSRSRSCENGVVGQGNCVGPETDTQVCSAGVGCDYWNEWSEWSSCGVTCGDGSQSRSRSCENGVVGQGNCVGSETDTQVCSARETCPDLFSCHFSDGLCGFTNTRKSDWKQIDGYAAAIINGSRKRRGLKTFSMISQSISSTSSTDMCLSLKYKTDGSSTRKLMINMHRKNENGDWESNEITRIVSKETTTCTTIEKTITSSSEFKISILSCIKGNDGYVHVDDLVITSGACA